MHHPDLYSDTEKNRLAALDSLGLLDTPASNASTASRAWPP